MTNTIAIAHHALKVKLSALSLEVSGGVAGFQTMCELVGLVASTPTTVPIIRWNIGTWN